MRSDTRSRNIFSLPQLSTKRERKHFGGNDPGEKQGGDARNNLLSFVKIQLASLVNKFQDEYITNTSTNSDYTKMDCHDGNNNDIKVNLVFGMCKFHASGQDDMDVCMILPPEAKDERLDGKITDKEKIIGSGRPFVCEVIDVYKVPTTEDWNKVVQTINQNGDGSNNSKLPVLEEIEITEDGK
jgi:hypothetical protein